MRKRIPELCRAKELRILAAAQRRFASNELAKVTIGDIAGDVKMGKATLYYYFPTKQDIFKGVIRREQDEFLSEMRRILSRKHSATAKLKAYVERRLRLTRRLLNLGQFLLRSWNDKPVAYRNMVESFAARERDIVAAILAEGQASGEFAVESPGRTAAMLLHALQGLRLRYAGSNGGRAILPVRQSDFEREVRLLLQTLLYGVVNPSHTHTG